jgi:predicted HicB family RNase H-like nuclease
MEGLQSFGRGNLSHIGGFMTTGRYGDLIKKAREPENQNTGLKEQNTNLPENQNTGLPENQNTNLPESQNEPEVNLCVKVPKSLRQHWAAEAKRQGTTMTAVIMAALNDRFGKPD